MCIYCDRCGANIYEGNQFWLIDIEGYPSQALCEECVEECQKTAKED